jgi:hypothetical protein
MTDHRAILSTAGFSPEDIERIEALWSQVTELSSPAALDDLSVPYRVGACRAIDAHRFSGLPIVSWGGKSILLWQMTEREREAWKRKKPRR